MDINLEIFDENSKNIIKEITSKNKKFNNLIERLKTATSEIDSDSKLKNTLEGKLK